MLNRWILVFAIALGSISLAGCRPQALTPTDVHAVDTAKSAYRAFADGDCETVETLTNEDSLEPWEFNEMRHSMMLLGAFCDEIDGDIDAARDIYRRLVVEAPSSFAADDAAERIRVLKDSEADPTYARRGEAARDRIDPSKPGRTAIDRVPVKFPPLAGAAGIEGYSIVEFGVTKEGETENPVVVDASPPLIFDGASIRAIRRWQYRRESTIDPDHRQLIRLLFQPDGQTDLVETTKTNDETGDETEEESTSTE
jgi:TonB family protein